MLAVCNDVMYVIVIISLTNGAQALFFVMINTAWYLLFSAEIEETIDKTAKEMHRRISLKLINILPCGIDISAFSYKRFRKTDATLLYL